MPVNIRKKVRLGWILSLEISSGAGPPINGRKGYKWTNLSNSKIMPWFCLTGAGGISAALFRRIAVVLLDWCAADEWKDRVRAENRGIILGVEIWAKPFWNKDLDFNFPGKMHKIWFSCQLEGFWIVKRDIGRRMDEDRRVPLHAPLRSNTCASILMTAI